MTVRDAGGIVWGPGKIGTMGTGVSVGSLASTASETYTFEVVFPDNGAPGGPAVGDNAYQGSSVTVDYAWELVNQ